MKAMFACAVAVWAGTLVAEPYRTYLDTKGEGSCGAVLIDRADGGIQCGIKGWYRRSDDGGRTWRKLYRFAKGAGTNLLRLRDGRLMSVVGEPCANIYSNRLQACNYYAYFSSDEGRTWDAKGRVPLSTDNRRLYLMNDRVMRLSSGRILVAFSLHPNELLKDLKNFENVGWVNAFYSDDEGATWHEGRRRPTTAADQMCEPNVFEKSDGTLVMLARTGKGYLYRCESTDGGESWGVERPTTLRSACAPFYLKKDPFTGWVFVAWDNSFPAPVHQYPRAPLSLAVSRDEGETWEFVCDIENDPMSSYGYPTIHFTKESVMVAYYEELGFRAFNAREQRCKLTIYDRRELTAEKITREPLARSAAVPVIGRPEADAAFYAHANRRQEGVPSVAVDPKTGRLWVTWYGGVSNSEDSNNYVVLATSADKGRTWKEVLAYDPDGRGPWRAFDCEIWVSPDGKLRWFWTERKVKLRGTLDGKDTPEKLAVYAGHSDAEAIKTDRLMMLTLAADREPTAPFGVPQEIGPGVMMCKPIVAANGDWVLPVSRWYEEKSARLVISSDGGRTFSRPEHGASIPAQFRTFDEHSVVQMKDGAFRIWARAKGGCRTAATHDGGRTWTAIEPATFGFPSTRTTVRRLKSGAILLVKHGADIRSNGGGRRCLTAFVSDDEARTWKGGLVLDPRKGGSYCDVDQSPDGTIHAVWDFDRTGRREILYARFTEEDVRRGWGAAKDFATQVLVSSGQKAR